jgi:hypothetical protein
MIIKESHHIVPKPHIVTNLSKNLLTAVARANNKQTLAIGMFSSQRPKKRPDSNSPGFILTDKLKIKTDTQPKSRDKQNGQAPIDDENRACKTFKPCAEQNKTNDEEATDAGGFDNIQQVGNARIAPHAAVKVEKIESDDLDGDNERKGLLHHTQVIGGNIEVEA